MNYLNEEIMLKEITEDYINIMQECNEEKFKGLWHPDAKMFGMGNSNQLNVMSRDDIIKSSLNGLRNLKNQIPNPEEIRFVIDEIIRIQHIDGVIANVELRWHMQLPGSLGKHHTFIQYAKYDDMWYIVNVLDRGLETE